MYAYMDSARIDPERQMIYKSGIQSEATTNALVYTPQTCQPSRMAKNGDGRFDKSPLRERRFTKIVSSTIAFS